jgi:host factor-I protein
VTTSGLALRGSNLSPDLGPKKSQSDSIDQIHRSAQPPRFVYNSDMAFRTQGNPGAGKHGRTPPPEDTFEEAAFLKAIGEKQKQVALKLMDGQTFQGWIEYYDKNMVRLTREGAPNLFIFKHEIMYIAEDGGKKK